MTTRLPKQQRVIPQAGAIPFRRHDGRVEFCLITSSKGKRWGFPKGLIDPGDTYVETALTEADEEAGLHGKIIGEPIGEYTYEKWDSLLSVKVVIMHVTHAADTWDEASIRERRWVSLKEANRLLTQPRLVELLKIANDTITKLAE
jgi:8-oxo-dGTP pyrophosphatase MutT (NUDIX family)